MKHTLFSLVAMLTPVLAAPAFAQTQPDLAFYGAHDCAANAPGAQAAPADGEPADGEPPDGEKVCLDAKPLFSGNAITAVSRDVDAATGQETAIVTLGESASTLIYAYTYANRGQRMGITLDGALVSAPVVQETIQSGQLAVHGLSDAQIAALVARFAVKTP